MMMDVRLLEATLDEIQAVLDAERNAEVVRAISEVVRASECVGVGCMDVIQAILTDAGVV
jgi:hypothetical protein